MALKAEFQLRRLFFNDYDDGEWIEAFGRSSSRKCIKHPILYSAFEAHQACAITGIWLWAFIDGSSWCKDNGGLVKWFIYLTHLSLTLQLVYTWASFVTTWRAHRMAEGRIAIVTVMPWYAKLTWLLQGVCLPLTLLVFVLYFALVVPDTGISGPLSFFTHGVNFLLMISDVFWSRQPFYLVHSLYFFCVVLAYLVFTYVFYKANGVGCGGEPYIYAAIDWRHGSSTLALLGFLYLIVGPIVNVTFWIIVNWCFPGRSVRVAPASVELAMNQGVAPPVETTLGKVDFP